MIASSDGAITVGGLSGGLGSPADTEVFMALRSVSDAIVVGAATARQERYRPPGGSKRVRARRAGRGQAPRPLLVVVTASLLLDGDLPMFSEAGYRPLIATVEAAPADRRATLSAVADVISVGADRVDLGQLMGELAGRGMQAVLVEGGPSLNAQLIAAELIDEWNLTLAPILVGAGPERAAAGPDLAHPITPMNLSRVWQEDDLLFCRWVRPAGEHGEAARLS
jgi:riboflavin biosynthesis pyrimidine reductase